MVQSCATQDDVNQEYVYTLTTSLEINRPPHPDHLAYTLRSRGHETRLALKDSFLEPGTPRENVFCKNLIIRWKSRARTAEGEASPLEKDSVE